MIGLRASVFSRLAVGFVFCLAAVALVWWVERGEPPPAVPVAAAPLAMARLRLEVESTYAVALWSVQVLGVAQPAAASDAWSWHGTVAVPAGEDVVVTAAAAPAALAAESPHHGLRLRLGDAPERLVWGSGDVVATGTAP
jgi:hypothetical protein